MYHIVHLLNVPPILVSLNCKGECGLSLNMDKVVGVVVYKRGASIHRKVFCTRQQNHLRRDNIK